VLVATLLTALFAPAADLSEEAKKELKTLEGESVEVPEDGETGRFILERVK
jgi:hypothetical protein